MWEVVSDDGLERTERMAFEGGWLVRSAWRRAGIGAETVGGSAMVFVEGPSLEVRTAAYAEVERSYQRILEGQRQQANAAAVLPAGRPWTPGSVVLLSETEMAVVREREGLLVLEKDAPDAKV